MYTYNSAAAAAAIRHKRMTLRLTQEAIASRLHIDRSYYGRLERGATIPTLSMLLDICNVLHMDPSDIIIKQ